MGLLDDAKNKASELISGNPDKVSEGIEKAGDFVDEKTGGKYAEQIDTAQEKAREMTSGGRATPETDVETPADTPVSLDENVGEIPTPADGDNPVVGQ